MRSAWPPLLLLLSVDAFEFDHEELRTVIEEPGKQAWSSVHHLALAVAMIALVAGFVAFAAPHGLRQAEKQALARAQAQRDAEVRTRWASRTFTPP